MKQHIYLIIFILGLSVTTSCNDIDTFSDAGTNTLSFSQNEIDLGLVFSTVPSATRDFWVYNKSNTGIVCSEVRLQNGNQTGFRVNVDGWFLGPESGYRLQNLEIASGDSARIFVELTSYQSGSETPKEIQDNLIFSLNGGGTQQITLKASSWDAEIWDNYLISGDVSISGTKPILVNQSIIVEENAKLTLCQGTTLYFANNAGLDVRGTLLCEGSAEQNVVLRGNRLDNMFDYLPYDRVSGQWQGIHFYGTSVNNEIRYTDIHSCFNGIMVDEIEGKSVDLTINASTIHNCQGYGLLAHNATLDIVNTQISNTLNDCVYIDGGSAQINASTLAQFYPFDSQRGAALRFGNANYGISEFSVENSIITGYADDVLMGDIVEGENPWTFNFDHCLIRTPKPDEKYINLFNECIFENTDNTGISGAENFILVDTHNLEYDFSISENSLAIDAGDPVSSPQTDRRGRQRDALPDMGAFEFSAEK